MKVNCEHFNVKPNYNITFMLKWSCPYTVVTLDVKQHTLCLKLQYNLQLIFFKNTFKILMYVFNMVTFLMCIYGPKQYAVTVTVNCWSISCSFDEVPAVVKSQLSFPYFSGMWGELCYWKWTGLEVLNQVQSCVYNTRWYSTS